MRITVRLTPGAGRDAVDGVVDGVLRARVAARPVDGAANESLRRLVATALDVAPSRVRIARGDTGRVKVIELDDVAAEVVRSRWPGIEV